MNPAEVANEVSVGEALAVNRPHVVIVGGGFGGLSAAKALGRTTVQVTLIDRTNYHLFQPLLYQVATAGLSPADIAAPIRSVLRNQRTTEVLMAEVTDVDVENRRVRLPDRELPYDYLILATGSLPGYFGHDEWKENAPGLKTIPDATAIRRRILLAFESAEMEHDPEIRKALLTFVLVGGGPTGVEMAGAIGEIAHKALSRDFRHIDPNAARILLVEAGPRILSSFPESLAAKAEKALNRLGVEVITNTRVEQIDEEGVVMEGERIPSRAVIWTAGVVASPAGRWLGADVDRGGRVIVKPDLSIADHPEIFVIGDTAAVEGQQLPGIAPVAMQQGRYAAWVIRARMLGEKEPGPFRYWDKGNLATVGRSFAILHKGRIQIGGLFAWLAWVVVHIWYLIGFRNRVIVMFEWIWAYVTFQRGARLIIPEKAEESAELAKPEERRAPLGP